MDKIHLYAEWSPCLPCLRQVNRQARKHDIYIKKLEPSIPHSGTQAEEIAGFFNSLSRGQTLKVQKRLGVKRWRNV
ncbi:MAG: hypothetical protein ABIL68_01905 [bacterium]